MYDSILIPTDGSAQAMNAVEEGIRLAARLGATVHALAVIDEFEAKIVPITGAQDEKRAEYREYAEDLTGEVADVAADAGVECVTDIRTGVTHREIVDYIEDEEIDMVVMGSRGLSNLEEMLLGSTADNVIRSVDIPVTVVHQQASERLDWMLRGQDTVHG
jgi:nucleotide-binding universal stress UspA family protein